MDITEFLTITLVSSLMIISPGPAFAIVTKNSLVYGRTSGLSTAWGIALADLCHILINLVGLGVIIAESKEIATGLKILGSTYLIYIGIRALFAKKGQPHSAAEGVSISDISSIPLSKSKHKSFWNGFWTGVLNPKAFITYLSFFSVVLSTEVSMIKRISYGIWIDTLVIVWFSLVALFFTHPTLTRHLQAFKHWIERVTGGILMLLGIRLLTTKLI